MLFDTTHYTYETIIMVFSGFSFYSDIFILLDEFLSQLFEFKTCKLWDYVMFIKWWNWVFLYWLFPIWYLSLHLLRFFSKFFNIILLFSSSKCGMSPITYFHRYSKFSLSFKITFSLSIYIFSLVISNI